MIAKHITKADEQFQEECQMFERMIGKPEFDRLKETVLSAIRQGEFVAHSDNVYCVRITLDSVDGSSVKKQKEERRYFRITYRPYGIPSDILTYEMNKAIQSEFPEIRVNRVHTENLSSIYHGCDIQDHSLTQVIATGFLMVLTTIALCGLPIIQEYCLPKPKITITVFFTQTKNV
jgi:hypothetical protein